MSDDQIPGPTGPIGPPGHTGPPGHIGPQGAPGVDAMERAGHLTEALRDHTKVLKRVLRRQRWQRLAIVLLFVLSGASVYLWNEVRDAQEEVRDAQEAACESGNSVRSGLLDIADVLEESGVDPEFVANMRSSFALRDCENA